MNIPEIYLVEPYNAYAPKGKKKHWMQEVEEQALLAKIIAEQQALREAAAKTGNTPNVLPPQAPPTSQAGAQGYSGGAGAAGGPNTTGGGGGAPRPQFFNPNMSIGAGATPSTASVPATIQFYTTGDAGTLALGALNISWDFGDGTTGGGPSPIHTYTTEGFIIAQMTASAVVNPSLVTMVQVPVTVSAAPLVAQITSVTGTTVVYTPNYYSASRGDTLTFTAATTNPVPVTYAWNFGDAGTATGNPVTHAYASVSTPTVTLTVTDAYADSVSGTRKLQITEAALTASIATPPDLDSGASPLTETFTNGSTVPAISNPVTWLWVFNSGSLPNITTQDAGDVTFDNPGTFDITLQATGSDGQKKATTISITAT